MRHQDLADDVIPKGNAYDEHGPYDLDFSAGPSRPPPIPYDDPYADEYPPNTSELAMSPELTSTLDNSSEHRTSIHGKRQDRGNDRGHRSRGRGRGRDREHGGHGRQTRVDTTRSPQQNNGLSKKCWDGQPTSRSQSGASYEPHTPRPLSPTSLAIAHATGQLPDGWSASMPHIHATNDSWGYQDSRLQQGAPFHFNPQGYPPPFVQPHINPRFASAFGLHMNMGSTQHQPYDPYEGGSIHSVSSLQTSDWADEWAVPTGVPDKKGVNNDTV